MARYNTILSYFTDVKRYKKMISNLEQSIIKDIEKAFHIA